MTYHNTTGESGIPLEEYEEKASVQERAILGHFRKEQKASPSEVQRMVLTHTPLTSVRRAITNLTAKGYLHKTQVTVRGRYARPEHVWIMGGHSHESG
jgi:hypothetical protein